MFTVNEPDSSPSGIAAEKETVDVEGAVHNSGMYQLAANGRVEDALAAPMV